MGWICEILRVLRVLGVFAVFQHRSQGYSEDSQFSISILIYGHHGDRRMNVQATAIQAKFIHLVIP